MITVTNLVKKFGDFTAVNDISFDVAQGEEHFHRCMTALALQP